MSILSRTLSAAAALPRATHEVAVEPEVSIPLPDGVTLVAERWHPTDGAAAGPVILIRSPYGRMGILGRLLAERGHQALLVSTRGTFGSAGTWNPFFHEQEDGRAVLQWVVEQPWCDGSIATLGPSYLGLTQWSVAADAGVDVKALSLAVTSSWFHDLLYPGGSFALETALSWAAGTANQELRGLAKLKAMREAPERLARGYAETSLNQADTIAAGRQIPYYQDWLEHGEPGDPWWSPIDFGAHIAQAPPTTMLAGWYDIFCQPQLEDYKRLVAAGRDVRLRVGPWHHGSPGAFFAHMRDSLAWMDRHLRGVAPDGSTPPVRVHVMGARRWVSLPSWPPLSASSTWHLQPGGCLATEPAPASPPDRYRYDPNDPTPSVGGNNLVGRSAGPSDNTELEARPDVLTFTTAALPADLTVIGELRARLHVRSSLEHTDVFVRLCDVSADGRSTNLADGIVRLRPGVGEESADGSRLVEVDLTPTANTFLAGHRIRVQVSSGAHPMYARNPGSGEPLGKATTFVVAEQELFHDPDHPSSIDLPVVSPAVPATGRLERWLTARSG